MMHHQRHPPSSPAPLLRHSERSRGISPSATGLFAYDANGNRTQLQITGSAVANDTETYTYDQLNRLTHVAYASGGGVTYEYDANGNRTQQTSGLDVTDYHYNAADELTSVSGAFAQTYTYDLDGNRVSAGTDTYQYDWRNRLTSATVDGTTATYTYAGDDLRASRTVGATTTPYLWDRLSRLPTIVSDGASAFVHGEQGLLEEIASGGNRTYPLVDGLGTVRARTNASGSVTGVSDYDAWGNVRTATGTQGLFGWTGEPRDTATGLTYLRARDYSPGTGRFVQRDTVSPNGPGTQGFNAYAYVAGNPTTFTDPSGHDFTSEAQVFAAWDMTGPNMIFILAFSSIVIGAGMLLTSIAGRGSQVFLLTAAIFRTLAVMGQFLNYCARFGVTCGGVINTVGWALIVAGTAGQAYLNAAWVRKKTCELALAYKDSYGFVLDIVSKCPGRPRGDHCELESATDFGYGMVSDALLGGGMAGPYGAYFSAIENGADALLTYYQCKRGSPPDDCKTRGTSPGTPPTGGIYHLIDRATGQVQYVGRTKSLANRGKQWTRLLKAQEIEWDFREIYRTDNYAELRGLEQIEVDAWNPPLNKIRPIAERNRNIDDYMAAGWDYLNCL